MSQDDGHDEVGAAARFPERAVGERGGSGRGARAGSGPPPDPELVERPRRRRFSATYKLEILERADAHTRAGEGGEVVRLKGLYTSHVTYCRKRRKKGALNDLG